MIRLGFHTSGFAGSYGSSVLYASALDAATGKSTTQFRTAFTPHHVLHENWASNSTPYQWQPLRGVTDIRIIQLYPAEDMNDTIVINITTHSGDNLPKYTALSYHWGDPQPVHDIAIHTIEISAEPNSENGMDSGLGVKMDNATARDYQKATIPHNLLTALQHLRQPYRPILVWTDFLCIDQKNILEKNEQVLRMHQIYSYAVSTTVFLGEVSADDHSDKIHVIIPQISAMLVDGYLESGMNPQPYVMELSRRIQDGLLDSTLFPEVSTIEDKWRQFQIALRRFFARPWFKRVWVVQEVVPAMKAKDKSKLIVLCGDHKLDWEEIVFAYVLNSWMPLTNTQDAEGGHAPVVQLMHKLEKSLSLFELLCHSQELAASDSRDHCFGLISMLDVARVPELKPDYSVDTREVFMRYTRFLVNEGLGQQLLMRCIKAEYMKPSAKPCSGLPSWAPDWSIPPSYEMPFSSTPHETFSAGGLSSGSFMLGENDLLITRGVVVDSVQAATHFGFCNLPGLDRFEKDIQTELQYVYWASQVLIHFLSLISNGKFEGDVAALIVRFLILDLQPRASKRLVRILPQAYDIIPSLLNQDWDVLDKCLESHEARHYLSNMYGNLRRSSIAMTARGYIARVPQTIELTDTVAIIVGCDVPLILSEAPNHELPINYTNVAVSKLYRIKDWAFVPGIMDGEAFVDPRNTIVDIAIV